MNTEDHRCPELPDVVGRFVTSVNAHAAAAVIATFADDALVNDEMIDRRGAIQIRSWVENDVVGKRLKLQVVGADLTGGRVVVTCHATGDFDAPYLPDPYVVRLYASIKSDRIAQLIILPVQT